eukprot:gene16922-biopygen7196
MSEERPTGRTDRTGRVGWANRTDRRQLLFPSALSPAGEGAAERQRKEAALPVMLAAAALCSVCYSIWPGLLSVPGYADHVAFGAGAALSWGAAAFTLATRRLPVPLIEAWTVGLVVLVIIPTDWAKSAWLQMRLWPLAVLCLDQLLVAGGRPLFWESPFPLGLSGASPRLRQGFPKGFSGDSLRPLPPTGGARRHRGGRRMARSAERRVGRPRRAVRAERALRRAPRAAGLRVRGTPLRHYYPYCGDGMGRRGVHIRGGLPRELHGNSCWYGER